MRNFLTVKTVERFIPLMERENVSVIARSQRGFLTAYLKHKGNLRKLGPEWIKRREAFIARHMAQLTSRHERLMVEPGVPSRRHLALIAWAYSPRPTLLRDSF